MNDIIKIIKSLEDSGVLIDGVTETVKQEIKKTRRRISRGLVRTFSHLNRKEEQKEDIWIKCFSFTSSFKQY